MEDRALGTLYEVPIRRERCQNPHHDNGTVSHYRTGAVVGIQGRDSYNILPTQIKLCRGAKENRPLDSLVQLCLSDFLKQGSYQEIPPSILNRSIFPLQRGNLKMFERPPLLSPFPLFEHTSFIEYLMSEEHLLRVSRTYDGMTEGLRGQPMDMIRVSVGQEVQFRCDGVVGR